MWKKPKEYSRVGERDIDHHPPPSKPWPRQRSDNSLIPRIIPPAYISLLGKYPFNITFSIAYISLTQKISFFQYCIFLISCSRFILLEVTPPPKTICAFPRLTSNPIWGRTLQSSHQIVLKVFSLQNHSLSHHYKRNVDFNPQCLLSHRDVFPDTSLMYSWKTASQMCVKVHDVCKMLC